MAVGIGAFYASIFAAIGTLALIILIPWHPKGYRPFNIIRVLLLTIATILLLFGLYGIVHLAATLHAPDNHSCLNDVTVKGFLKETGNTFALIFIPGFVFQYIVRVIYRRQMGHSK